MATSEFRHPPAANEAIFTTPAQATNIEILAANANRLPGTRIENTGNSRVYIRLGSAAATSVLYAKVIAPRSGWTVPGWYTGAIQAISPPPSTPSGAWVVTEQLP